MHSSTDPVVAVLAADFTLGYWYKLILDLEPACANDARSGLYNTCMNPSKRKGYF